MLNIRRFTDLAACQMNTKSWQSELMKRSSDCCPESCHWRMQQDGVNLNDTQFMNIN